MKKLKHNKENLFFTSDLHIFHNKILEYDNRPFHNIDEMHNTLIENWNQKVNQNSIIYYLGDLSFSNFDNTKDFVSKLNGKIYYIMGNHDRKKDLIKLNRFEEIYEYGTEVWIKDEKENHHVIMSHYPIYSWNRKHHNSIMLHGHCHHSLDDTDFHKENRILDVGCNGHNYFPISFGEVLELINAKNLKYV